MCVCWDSRLRDTSICLWDMKEGTVCVCVCVCVCVSVCVCVCAGTVGSEIRPSVCGT